MKQLLTGQCLIDFEKWLRNNPFNDYAFEVLVEDNGGKWDATDKGGFFMLPDSMQYGVLVDFFDSVGVYISIIHNIPSGRFYFDISINPQTGYNDICFKEALPRPEARKAAIEKSVELYNQQR